VVIVKSTAKRYAKSTGLAFFNIHARVGFLDNIIAFVRAMKQWFHVQERRAQKDKHHGDPGDGKQTQQQFLVLMLTACKLKGLFEFSLRHLNFDVSLDDKDISFV
jgi:hypothetical protein